MLQSKINNKQSLCIICGKKVSTMRVKYCRSCSAKKNIQIRMLNGHINPNCILFSENEEKILKEGYYDWPRERLCNELKRSWSSISHRALRIGLKRTRKFEIENRNRLAFKNGHANIMKKKEIREKVIRALKAGYASGKIKIGGIALKSMNGLTKKENHPNWLGGISFEPYDKNWDDEFKQSIKQRDNHSCQICGCTNRLHVHHIDYNKKNSTEQNCITLCNRCHIKTNYNREKWQDLFKSMMSAKYLTIKCTQQPR